MTDSAMAMPPLHRSYFASHSIDRYWAEAVPVSIPACKCLFLHRGIPLGECMQNLRFRRLWLRYERGHRVG